MEVLCLLLCGMVLFLYNWVWEAVREAHTMPGMKRVDIYRMVRSKQVPEPVLQLLATQTGVNEAGVATLLEQGMWWRLLDLQMDYFAPVLVESVPGTPLTITEYLVDEQGSYIRGTQLLDIQDGDILITKNSRFLGWRNGHAGLVVDAEAGLVLEAVMLGMDTKLCSLEKWEEYPAVMVLRLKAEANMSGQSQKAVAYASRYLVDIPYQLLAGVRDRLFATRVVTVHAAGQSDVSVEMPTVKGTQCAHLVWYAYKQVGIDLDSDGGILVTPYDIQMSPYLEVIQSYGY